MKRFSLACLFALLSVSAFAQDPSASGTISATTPCPGVGCVRLTNLSSREMVSVVVSGTWVGTLVPQIASSGAAVRAYDATTKVSLDAITANGTYLVPIEGANAFRIVATAWTSGSASVSMTAGTGASSFVKPSGIVRTVTYTFPTVSTPVSVVGGQWVYVNWNNTGSLDATCGYQFQAVSGVIPTTNLDRFTNMRLGTTGRSDRWIFTPGVSPLHVFPVLPGAETFTISCGTYNSGTAVVTFTVTNDPPPAAERAFGQSGDQTLPSYLVQVGGVDVGDGFNLRPLSLSQGALRVDASPSTTLPLPSGASTSAKQDTGNASLASIDAAVAGLATQATLASLNSKIGAVSTAIGNTIDPTSLLATAGKSVTDGAYYPIPLAGVGTSVQVSAQSLPLPSGAATSAAQTTGNASLASIDGKLPAAAAADRTTAAAPSAVRLSDGSAFYKGTTPSDTQPVSAASLPLPSGASTSALQTTGNSSLSSIDGKTPALGQALAAASVPVVLTAAQLSTLTPLSTVAITAAALPLPAGASTSALQTSTNTKLDSLITDADALNSAVAENGGLVQQNLVQIGGNNPSDPGNAAMVTVMTTTPGGAENALVTRNIPSGTQAVSAAALPLPSGAATSALQSTGNTSVGNIDTKTPALGQAAMAASSPVVIASNQSAVPVSSTQLPAALAAGGGLKIEGIAGGVAVPTSLASLPSLASGTNNIGDVDVLTLPAVMTDRTQKTQITDGTRDGTVKAASTAAAAADTSVVVALHPSSPLPAGSNTIGALTANQSMNQTQINGVAVSVDRGASDTGTQRFMNAQEATYAASTAAKTATAAGTAAFFEICGSASKTIRIQRIAISGTVATAAIYGDIQLRKTSAAATGGTATTLTNTSYDSNNAAATATVKYFTVLPTGGATLVGNIFSQTLFFPVTGTVASFLPQLVYLWRDQDAESPTLRGTAQCMTAAFGTTPTNAPTLSVSVAWTEK